MTPLVVRVRLRSLDGRAYRLYALNDPALDNSGGNDRARTVGHTLVAVDADSKVSSAFRSRPRFGGTTNGYFGQNDGWTELRRDHRLTHHYRWAGPGNVVQTGRVTGVTGKRGHQYATLTLGFGRKPRAAYDGSTSPRHWCWPPPRTS